MKWDREIIDPAEFIFPEKIIREHDINGYVLREVCANHPTMGQHHLTLSRDGYARANAIKVGRSWSLAIGDAEWPHKHIEYRFGLTKVAAIKALREIGNDK